MLEVKIIRALNAVYRGAIRLAMKSVDFRDRVALKKLDCRLERAQVMCDIADRLRRQAPVLEQKAHDQYAEKAVGINESYNTLANALDDSRL